MGGCWRVSERNLLYQQQNPCGRNKLLPIALTRTCLANDDRLTLFNEIKMKLDLFDAHAIDYFLYEIYHRGRNFIAGEELPQLYRLFENNLFTMLIGNHLSHAIKAINPNDRVEFSIGWIDKRPVAKIKEFSSKIELADAAVIYIELKPGASTARRADCLLLQSKVVRSKSQLENPVVPLTTGKSTDKEYALLSRWPKLSLFEYGSSKNALAKDLKVSIDPSCKIPGHGWFMGIPRVKTKLGIGVPPWLSPWMCGPASQGAKCDVTLGELLVSFFSHGNAIKTSARAGERFQLNLTELIKTNRPTSDGWDRICIEILRAIDERDLPRSLGAPRGSSRRTTAIFQSFPGLLGSAQFGKDIFNSMVRLFFPRFPVFLVTRTSEKYEEESQFS